MAPFVKPPHPLNIIDEATGLAIDFLVRSCHALLHSKHKPYSLLVGLTPIWTRIAILYSKGCPLEVPKG